MLSNATDEKLSAARKKIFSMLLRRLAQLYLASPIPESFYNGQPYVEDKRKVNSIIAAHFIFPGYISPFDFWLYGAHVVGTQHGNLLLVRVYKRISQQLWDDLRLIPIARSERFIIGYLASYMPTINRYLLDTRYFEGHLLARTFALFEAVDVSVTVNHRRMFLNWPISFATFPRSATIAKNVSELYVHDFIDSINSYFRSDFDDCIRRVVTSAETLFQARSWRSKAPPDTLLQKLLRFLRLKVRERPNTFRRVLSDNIEKNRLSGQVINENMQFIYTVRNRIVHGGFRMSTSSELFCAKAIATLKYLMAGYCADAVISRYINTLNVQFNMQREVLGSINNLDVIQKQWSVLNDEKPIDSLEELDRVMFGALRFTECDRHSISR
jgi:hypothetical protein